VRQGDIVSAAVPPEDFDLVTARAVLHHVADAHQAVAHLVQSARSGGTILLIEPDFLPVTIAEPQEVRAFWYGWLAWSRDQGIDYHIGRKLPAMLADLGLENVEAAAETALYNGGSPWAVYWEQTIVELRPRLISSGHLDDASTDMFLSYVTDSRWWTQTIAFTAVSARVPTA